MNSLKAYVTAFILLSTLSLSYSQEQLKAEKRVTFGQDGKLFVAKDLGIYLWLSTSPEEDAPMHRLKSDSSKRYSNPMFFDTEGYNTLRSPSAVDSKTKKLIYPLQDIIFEVYADGASPKTSKKILYNKTFTRAAKKYYSGNKVQLTLKAYDKVSGVDKIYYSINGAAYTEYTDTVTFKTEGEKKIKIYSADRVGNVETPIETTLFIDNSAPTSTYVIEGQQNDKFVSPKAKIKLSSEDNLVGVKAIYYKLNNGPRQVYKSPIPVKLLGADGNLTFYAVDYLNNEEALQVIGGNSKISSDDKSGDNENFEFYVDNTAPTVELDLDGSHSKGQYTYVSKSTKIKVKADDDKSGVDKIQYSINSTKIDQTYSDGVEFTDEGIAYIRVNAIDYVGNTSPTVTLPYFVDDTPPATSISIIAPKHKIKDTLFISSKTKIKLTATDKASGVKETFYKISGSDKQSYKAPFQLDQNGRVNIEYFSTDNVDNLEANQSLEVYVDNTAPIIYHHFSTTSIGTKSVRDLEYTIYPSNVKLYIAATDERSGGEKIEYSINNSTIKSTNPIKGLAPGNYEIEVTAYDVLGNSSNETLKFSIEN